ncbi:MULTISPECIES: extracellular solute-binding protein [unclassified Halomonas]|uniref:extracellular solute-binding protein n=1 Tax=unclassified Halomonas TaxID=2609666 RepID=UPI002883D7D5|nr:MULTISPECIES: extracellular solute-binding protein [unclassified Halomonas]MDT0499489.1 extracellular solute-binding protein [Halomonas sp. PAR7]MDT0510694.1 extracellular solute-binding protein [Halomonas sp. LES1]MDT0592293.1 extracellular solute-binding protein [Halomonas sp. PAR8]
MGRPTPFLLVVLVALWVLMAWGPVVSAEPLRVLSWGGAYERAQREALFTPFTEQTGIEIEVARYAGGLDELRRAIAAGEVPWDVIDMTRSEAMAACDEGLLQPLPPDLAAPAPDGTPAERDFIPGAIGACALTHTLFATVVAYRPDAFPGRRPSRIADLFDQQRFPGPRALQHTPAVNLEWALLASGVPRQELYRLLSTPRGLSLALKRLDQLDTIRWWEEGEAPVELLTHGQVVMASGYNGRFFNAMVQRGAPLEILWDGQVQEHETWVIPRHARHPRAARDFIRFATSTERLAALARRIPYGPARESAAFRVGRHPVSGVDMRLHIPTHPLNAEHAITKDEAWYARTLTRMNDYFAAWLEARGDDFPAAAGPSPAASEIAAGDTQRQKTP